MQASYLGEEHNRSTFHDEKRSGRMNRRIIEEK
jgi:hypothetical protein